MITKSAALEIARRARDELSSLYGRRMKGAYLFGSCARGNMREDSDIDIGIILDDITDVLAEIDRTGEIFAELGLETGAVVSRVFLRQADFETGRYALHRNIKSEGIRL